MSTKSQDKKKQQKKEARRAKAQAQARANIEKRRREAQSTGVNKTKNSKKGARHLSAAPKPKKQMRPSTRGWIALFGGIIVFAIMMLLMVTAVLMGHDAPCIYGTIGIFNMALSFIMLYIGLTALKEDGTSLRSARVGMGFSIATIVFYVFLYCIGLS